ncbi:hypothetical protein [Amycolatopsis ultiminotia]|uniref:hypothetical protein n=1 Tax=Amycolatopsis ultiminotia TaxID=543629 RepID=UPI0031E5159C
MSTDVQLSLDPSIESALYFGFAELVTNTPSTPMRTGCGSPSPATPPAITVEVEDDGQVGWACEPRAGSQGCGDASRFSTAPWRSPAWRVVRRA